MYQYYVRSLGASPVVIDSFIDLAYTKKMNDIGSATITVRRDHPAVSALALDDEIEIWRQRNGSNQIDFRGFARGGTFRTLNNGKTVYEIFVVHEMELLRRSVNAYKAGLEAASQFTSFAADTVMLQLVSNNFLNATQSIANSHPRLTQATSKVLAAGAYTAFGSRVATYGAAYKNVLSALQELADVDKSMFYITKVGSAWFFYVQPETVTTDRRATVLFDIDAGNMQDGELNQQRVGEMTVGFVTGQGEGNARTVEVRTTADRIIGTNNYEMAIDARHLTSSSSLQAYGDGVLNATRYRPKLRFRPAQLASLNYGQHYFWGDVVTARYNGTSFVQRIMQVTVRKNAQGEQVDLGLEDIP